jgi:hypothetical protein
METERPLLEDAKLSEIRLFCDVARANGSALSVRELIDLASLDSSEADLSLAWGDFPELREYTVSSSGFVIGREGAMDLEYLEREKLERRRRAGSNMYYAAKFASLARGSGARVLSVSGSTSYLSVSATDDLDFFLIARRGALWPSFVKRLLLARAFRLAEKGSPSLCLSYVVDESYALKEFSKVQDGLFARDALATRVLRGGTFYGSLLSVSSWMGRYFPKLYAERVRNFDKQKIEYTNSSPLARVANMFLFYVAGTYIKTKSLLLNRKYAKQGRRSSLFKVRLGLDHCIYESIRYLELRRAYSSLREKSADEKRSRGSDFQAQSAY